MESKVKISVIVPIYNAEKYLHRCISSILNQTFSDYEIILVNDGSKDNSLKLCQEFALKDSRIKVVDKENGGPGSARNAGIEVASGEYLAFPDPDDWFEPEMYEELYSLAKLHDYDIVFSGVNFYKQVSEGETKYSYTSNCKEASFLTKEDCRKNVMHVFPTSTIFDVPWNKLYKRSIAISNNVRFPNIRRCQDATFNIDFYNYVEKIAVKEKAYYNYMENTQQDVWRKFPKTYIDINTFYYTHLKEILNGWGMYLGDIKKHYDSSFVIAVYETLGMCNIPNWNLSKTEKKQYVLDILNKEVVVNFLKDVSLRDDVLEKYKILKEKNVDLFFKNLKKEQRKEKLRNNAFLRKIYNLIKRK